MILWKRKVGTRVIRTTVVRDNKVVMGSTREISVYEYLHVSARRPWKYWGGFMILKNNGPATRPTYVKEFGIWNWFRLKYVWKRIWQTS